MSSSAPAKQEHGIVKYADFLRILVKFKKQQKKPTQNKPDDLLLLRDNYNISDHPLK